jgi:hypothetical protein
MTAHVGTVLEGRADKATSSTGRHQLVVKLILDSQRTSASITELQYVWQAKHH